MEFRFEGIKELHKKLKKGVTMEDVKKVVSKNGQEMTAKMVNNADFTKGYATGATKRSIYMTLTDGGLTAEAGPTTEYSLWLEVGTRYMEAQPFIRPSFEDQKKRFKADLERLMR